MYVCMYVCRCMCVYTYIYLCGSSHLGGDSSLQKQGRGPSVVEAHMYIKLLSVFIRANTLIFIMTVFFFLDKKTQE